MLRRRHTKLVMAAAVLAVLSWNVAARAQQQVGTVAALEGQAEVLHPGQDDWNALVPADAVLRGDRVRTLAASKLKLLFDDDSVLTLAASSELTVDEQVLPAEGGGTSHFSLLVGMVRALVSGRYGAPGARFEMETPTAVAGVRGTRFITAHDTESDETMIVGVSDVTLVRSKSDPEARHEIELRAGETTRIQQGRLPLQPAPIPQEVLKSLTTATQIAVGKIRGTREAHPVIKIPKHPVGRAPRDRDIDQPIQELRDLQGGGGTRPPPPPPPIPK